jgi:EREBP-like factor
MDKESSSMDKEDSFIPETMVTSSTASGASSKSASTVKGGVKRIRTQNKAASSSPQERTLKLPYPTYKGVRRRSWGKWVSEIKEPKKKSKVWLGSFDTPEMAARAYDVAEFYLKGKKHALLNFPEMIDHLSQPISLSPRDIQVAAEEAAVAFYINKQERKSPRNPPVSNKPPSSSHQLFTVISSDFQTTNVELSGQKNTSNSSSICTPTEGVGESECIVVEEDLFESFNLSANLAEAPLLSPPLLFSIHEEEHNLEEGSLWPDF